MDERIDNGDIVAQRAVPIQESAPLDTLYPKAFGMASPLLAEAMDACASGSLVRRPNPEAKKTYFSYLSQERIKECRRRVAKRSV